MSRKKITVEGIEYPSIAAACRAHGLKKSTYDQRIKRGLLTGDDVFKTPPQKPYTLKHGPIIDGVMYNSIAAACKAYGINQCTVNTRIKRGGMALVDALKKPLTPIEDSTGTKLPVGTTRKNSYGYLNVKIPLQDAKKYKSLGGLKPNDRGKYWVLQHRYVMAKHLGRDLLPNEIVHHKNGDRTDNRIENLELCCDRQPPGQRKREKISFYIDYIKEHAPHLLSEAAA